MQILPPMPFPLTLLGELMEDLNLVLSPQERVSFEGIHQSQDAKMMAALAYAEWQGKCQTEKPELLAQCFEAHEPGEAVKTTIQKDPLTALQCYLKYPHWWTLDEMLKIVGTDPAAALAAAKTLTLTEQQIYKLQQDAGREPELAYRFAVEIEGALPEVANCQLSRSCYWAWRLATERNPTNRAEDDANIEKLVFTNPEAASFVLFRTTDPNYKNELMRIAVDTLALHPQVAHHTAVRLASLSIGEDDWRMAELKQICLKSPQWPFHWARDLDPAHVEDYLAACMNHLGWATELVLLIGQIYGENARMEAARKIHEHYLELTEKIPSLIQNPWYLPFLIWACGILITTEE